MPSPFSSSVAEAQMRSSCFSHTSSATTIPASSGSADLVDAFAPPVAWSGQNFRAPFASKVFSHPSAAHCFSIALYPALRRITRQRLPVASREPLACALCFSASFRSARVNTQQRQKLLCSGPDTTRLGLWYDIGPAGSPGSYGPGGIPLTATGCVYSIHAAAANSMPL
jgi:hypothetical protein